MVWIHLDKVAPRIGERIYLCSRGGMIHIGLVVSYEPIKIRVEGEESDFNSYDFPFWGTLGYGPIARDFDESSFITEKVRSGDAFGLHDMEVSISEWATVSAESMKALKESIDSMGKTVFTVKWKGYDKDVEKEEE